MKFLFLILFAAGACSTIHAQKKIAAKTNSPLNLVANGSFEDINVCTEFEALCEPEAWYFLPSYIVEPQGNDSNRYEMIAISNTVFGGRPGNYLYTKLLCPLREGKGYFFSMWINTLRNDFEHLDVYFTWQEPTNHLALNTVRDVAFSLIPDHHKATHGLWKKYTYMYIATGEEQFMTLGNFSNKPVNKNKLTPTNKQGDVLYAIDNVTLYPADEKEKPCMQYYGAMKQLYDQNYRHPAKMLQNIPPDTLARQGYVMAKSKTTARADTLTIPDILFRYNSSKVNPVFNSKLQLLVTNLRIRNYSTIEIAGHTDSIGNPVFNKKLSLQRAEAIRQIIAAKLNIPGKTIEVKGAGESQPIAPNSTPEGRRKNRRVEVILRG